LIPGEIQARNAALSIAAIKLAFPELKTEAMVQGLGNFKLPGRFERILEDPVFMVDGAHTPRSMGACVETCNALFGKQGVLLVGYVAWKDTLTMAKIVIPNLTQMFTTTPGSLKVSFPEQVYEAFRVEVMALGRESVVNFLPNTAQAIAVALEQARSKKLPLLGQGSFIWLPRSEIG
jgi:folylpolyglutamate synthase/dihydropteroate synthase